MWYAIKDCEGRILVCKCEDPKKTYPGCEILAGPKKTEPELFSPILSFLNKEVINVDVQTVPVSIFSKQTHS